MRNGSAPLDIPKLIDDLGWSTSKLGARECWPRSLKTIVDVVLASAFPMFLVWGAERILIYNDAYAPLLGDRHPAALGAGFFEVWPEVETQIEPIIEKAYEGAGSYFENLPVVLHRFGFAEQTCFTFSYTPIKDDNGCIGGALCVCVETTETVEKAERQAFLLRFRERLRTLREPAEIISAAQEELGIVLGAVRVGYGGVETSERFFTTDSNWTDGSVPHHNGVHDLTAFGEPIHSAIRRGETLVVHDVGADERTLPAEFVAAFDALQIRSAVTVSLVKEGKLVAALYVHDKVPRHWSASQVATIEEIAEATWAALERQIAEVKLRQSEQRYRRIFEQTSDLIITATLEQTITDCNPAAAEAVGVARESAIGRNIAEFIAPEDVAQTFAMLRRKLQGGGTTRYDVRVQNSAGEWLYWEINSGLTTADDGRPVELHVVGRDVTERKRAEEQQRLLINELNHRVKNTLAIVQSIGRQTLLRGGASRDVLHSFESRLGALAAAHDVLTRESWSAASMGEIVANALAPFCSEGCCRLEGPDSVLE
jgi:PAS domain S-box-containing protein